MIVHKCDQCRKETPADTDHPLKTPDKWIAICFHPENRGWLCSWKCVQEYAKEMWRALEA